MKTRLKFPNQLLKAFEFDATESPDLFPPLVALASYCEGISSIKGVSRLIFKESDRAKTLKEEFAKNGN
jgi:3-phosphoshikimate 1-carboxyvinyltransferase